MGQELLWLENGGVRKAQGAEYIEGNQFHMGWVRD
jgi:hypothetical protein